MLRLEKRVRSRISQQRVSFLLTQLSQITFPYAMDKFENFVKAFEVMTADENIAASVSKTKDGRNDLKRIYEADGSCSMLKTTVALFLTAIVRRSPKGFC